MSRGLGLDDPGLRENLRTSLDVALEKLRKEQKPDGGWGWFSNMESNPLVTAYAALGLIEARDAGMDFDTSMIDRALNYVRQRLIRPNIDTPAWRLNRQAFFLYVIARNKQATGSEMDELADYRLEMSLEARAFLLMAYHELGPPPTGTKAQAMKQALISDLQTAAVVSATGNSGLLVQRTIDVYGHCRFGETPEEGVQAMVRALIDLASWVEDGIRPTP